MKTPHIGIQSVALALILLPTAAGIVAIDASATCQRFVRTYITVPVRQHVSKATAMAWAKWRVGHPNWKPKPGAKRIGVPMTRVESIKKVDFACDIDTDPSILDSLLASIPPTEPPMSEPPVEEISQIAPPTLAHGTPIPYVDNNPSGPVAPYVPTIPTTGTTPITPPITDVTPEPSSLLLLATGIATCSLFWRRRIPCRA
jgi:hypothetical protein